MITGYYWQNTDIRKKILIITRQFVFFPPHPHQPWHPWTISIYSVFPQSHGFLDLWSFWLPSLRTNWSKCSLSTTCQMGQTIPAEEREAWGIYTPHLQGFRLGSSSGVCYFHNGTALLAEVQFRMCWGSLDSSCRTHSVLLLQPLFLPVLSLFLSRCLYIYPVHFSNL